MKELTIYDPNISWAKHTIKVSFMIRDYKDTLLTKWAVTLRGYP